MAQGTGTITSFNGTVAASTEGYGTISLGVSGVWVATLILEATLDDSNWFTITGINLANYSVLSIFTTADITQPSLYILVACSGFSQVRIRSTSFTSGTVNIAWDVNPNPNLGVGTSLAVPTPLGTFDEYNVPTGVLSSPFSICLGPDGNLWFTEFTGNKIGKVTTSGTFTEFTVPTSSSQPTGICLGPDGNLWFVEGNGNKIGKVTTSGTFTEFTVPTSTSLPQSICTGPDGNLWFIEQAANKVGKVTTAGSFTEFTVPTSTSGSQSICSGPDGNLWFVETTTNKIGKVTTSGTFTEFTVPTSSSQPTGLCVGPDNNLWFTEFAGNKIGRVTTAGSFTEFTIPSSAVQPKNICIGPDGNLWFTETGSGRIGQITTYGAFAEYSIPTASSSPNGICLGPDGNLWFVEQGSNKTARLNFISGNSVPEVTSTGALLVSERKDSNRVYVTFTADAVAGVTSETLMSMTLNRQGAITASQTNYVITSGKTLRIESITVAIQSGTSSGEWVRVKLKHNTGGAVTTASPLVYTVSCGTSAAVSAIMGQISVPIPDGIEFYGNGVQTIGISHISSATSNVESVTVCGYEY